MRRRELVAASGASLAAAIAGCVGSDDDPADDSADDAGTSDGTSDDGNGDDGSDPDPEPTTLISIRDVEDRYDDDTKLFSGSSEETTETFELDNALTVAIFEHDGESAFEAALLDADGERVELLVETTGAVEGAFAFPMAAGEYAVDIVADGDWSVELAQPDAPSSAGADLPAEATGTGEDVVGPVSIDGQATVSGEHDGEAAFKVYVYDESATSQFDSTVVFNATGEFEGRGSVSFDDRVWISVVADGAWTIELD